MSDPIELEWGRTPWDDLPREELLREVQRMYSAVESLRSALRLASGGQTTGFYGPGGTAGQALLKGDAVVLPIRERYDGERLFRAFYRYADTLLFDDPRIEYRWLVCDTCPVMGITRDTSIGEPCRACQREGCEPGKMRALTWDDLAPSPTEPRR